MTARASRGPCLSLPDAAAYMGGISVRTLERLSAECSAELPIVHLTGGPRGRRGVWQADCDAYMEKRTVGRAS